ncbi:MAG TPA: phosphoribosylformylglycinamidine synthase subunit PurQ, partial [Planctomycetota bacterium]|nr:phosphoribosylformylglycinamidine synthase subunit PurQ [Planctomycetota bacterium]
MAGTKVKVIVLRAAGVNCDREMVRAFEMAGAQVELVHIQRLVEKSRKLSEFDILGVPGGFTYGDDISAGRILATELTRRLGDDLRAFVDKGRPVIGVCNGFQVLVKTGILPGPDKTGEPTIATLTNNDSGQFECRWIRLLITPGNCIWTRGMQDQVLDMPVAHGEGKFLVGAGSKAARALLAGGQTPFLYSAGSQREVRHSTRLLGAPDVPKYNPASSKRSTRMQKKSSAILEAVQYPHNPNGSPCNIAGVCDTKGLVLGLMPHPERYILACQHPYWTRQKAELDFSGSTMPPGAGLKIFQNAVNYVAGS